jgi:hypothetical protein
MSDFSEIFGRFFDRGGHLGVGPHVIRPGRTVPEPDQKIDPRSNINPRSQYSARWLDTQQNYSITEPPLGAGFAEVKGICSVATLQAIRDLLADKPDEYGALAYRFRGAATGVDINGDITAPILTDWKLISSA